MQRDQEYGWPTSSTILDPVRPDHPYLEVVGAVDPTNSTRIVELWLLAPPPEM